MVHFLKQRTKYLTVQILGFLTVRIADVTEHLEMQRGKEREGEREPERENCVILMPTIIWVSKCDKWVKSFWGYIAM